jgi:predicted ribosomally synthesized peptide with SipW-like signal peptide
MKRRSPLVGGATILLVVAAVAAGVGGTLAAFTSIAQNTGSEFSIDALAAPADLSASGNPDVTLSWTASTSSWASGYRVYRGTSSGGPYSEIGTVDGVSTTTFNDTPGAGTFYYVVRAFLGGTTWTSPATNEVGATTSGYRDAVLNTSGLVSYWRLGESSDPTAADATGANSGSYQGGVTLGAGGALNEPDTAVSFDGGSAYVDVPDAASLQPAQISVEAWVKAGSGLADYGTVAMKTTDGSWTDGYGLYWAGGSIWFFVNHWSDSAVSTAINYDEWTHVVGTYDGSDLRLYVNGTEVASQPQPAGITHSGNQFLIGQGTGGYFWAGELDEVAVYNVALTGAQVQDHYNAR